MKKLAIFFLLIPIFSFADNDRWVKYGEADDGGLGFVDNKTAKEVDDGFVLWTKETKMKCSEIDKQNGCYSISKKHINCNQGKLTLKEVHLYKTKNSEFIQSFKSLNADIPIAPDTMGEKLFNATCKE